MTRTKALLAALSLVAGTSTGEAQSCGGRTLNQIIASCDDAFDGLGLVMTTARGWCYLLNSAACVLP